MRKNSSPVRFDRFDESYFTTGAYDDYLARFEKEEYEHALRLVKLLNPDSDWCFLDVGCGMGGLVMALRELGFKAWGTEISPYCLKNSPARKWMVRGELSHLPFLDDSFEVVSCVEVLYYLPKSQIKAGAGELIRVTDKYLYLDTICLGSSNSDQKYNPDCLRNDNELLSRDELQEIFMVSRAKYLRSFEIKSKDFNGIFVKNH